VGRAFYRKTITRTPVKKKNGGDRRPGGGEKKRKQREKRGGSHGGPYQLGRPVETAVWGGYRRK